MVHKVQLAHRVLLDHLECLAHRAEQQVKLDHKEAKVFKVLQVEQDHKVFKVHLVHKALKVFQVIKVHKVPLQAEHLQQQL